MAWEIAWLAPQVIMYRTLRMMGSGWPLTARDRREYTRMCQEKVQVISQLFSAAGPFTSAATWERMLTPIHRRVSTNQRRLAGG
jgi:hypothetical protein